MDSSLNQWYGLILLCVLVHFMCIAVLRPFTDSSVNPQYRLILLVHLCTYVHHLNEVKMLLAL